MTEAWKEELLKLRTTNLDILMDSIMDLEHRYIELRNAGFLLLRYIEEGKKPDKRTIAYMKDKLG